MMTIEFSGQTDTGLVRSNNEDIFLFNPLAFYCLVADGMGGAAAGETASQIFAQTARTIFGENIISSEQDAVDRVHEIFRAANDAILAHVAEYPQHQGMGCTAELLVFTPTGYVIGHMGDSRTYRIRQGVLKRLTRDHSLVQNQIDHGLITEEQARSHSHRNVILRAVGVGPSPALDTLRGPIHPGDLFMLCSDGLTDLVTDEAIAAVLKGPDSLQEKSRNLIVLANQAGGKDNITAVLAQVS